jgi:peptide/nickel transport system permease protein
MSGYLKFIAERFLVLIVTVFISITVVFFVPRLVPGNPLGAVFLNLAQVGGSAGATELVAEYERIFGLDQSLWDQYVRFWRELLRGNFGYSISSFPSEVSTLLVNALPWTIGLLTVTTLIAWALGSILGAIAGWRGQHSWLSRLLVPTALVLYTTPYYILAIILIFLLTYQIPIFPTSRAFSLGMRPGWNLPFILDVGRHAFLPALSIILVSLGWWFLSMRSLITGLKGEDYIVNAEAMGVKERRIMWGYAFRNALLPQATGLAIAFGHVVGGALVTEVIFAYPGIGWLIFNSIKGLDYPVIQGGVLLIIVSVAIANFAIDCLYPLIDPRIRYQSSGQ